MNRRLFSRSMVFAASALPVWAHAHGGAHSSSYAASAWQALTNGFMHPFTGMDHIAAMLALSVWSAVTMRRVWVAPLAFTVALMAGALLGLSGLMLPAVEPVIAASVVILGVLVTAKVRVAMPVVAAVAAGFALFHGSVHGVELAGPQVAWAMVGMVAAACVLHAAGLMAGSVLMQRRAWMRRVVGIAVALAGTVLLVP